MPVALTIKALAETVEVEVFKPPRPIARRVVGPLAPPAGAAAGASQADQFLGSVHGVLRAEGVPLAAVGEWMALPRQRMRIVDSVTQSFLCGPIQTTLQNEITRVVGAPCVGRSFVPPAPVKCTLQQLMALSMLKPRSMAANAPSCSRMLRYGITHRYGAVFVHSQCTMYATRSRGRRHH